MMDIESAEYRNLTGGFDFHDIYAEMVLRCPFNATFVEVGCFRGKSSIYLAEMVKLSGKKIELTFIDCWEKGNSEGVTIETFKEFMGHLAPYKVNFNVIKGFNGDFAPLFEDNSIDFVFIDGAHDYNSVKGDFMNWFPKVKVGGYIGGHDYTTRFTNDPDVKKAVDELFPAEVIMERWASCLIKKTEGLKLRG